MSTFKQIIWNLTDFEFLGSLSSVDFHNKTCFVKPHYYNTLIGMIKKNVAITSKRELITVINYIKSLYKQRLGMVSPHSMNRFFRDEIRISFRAFHHRLSKFFDEQRKTEEPSQPTALSTEERKQKKRLRRKAAKLRKQQMRRQLSPEPSIVLDPQNVESESGNSEPPLEAESSDLGSPRAAPIEDEDDDTVATASEDDQPENLQDEEELMYQNLVSAIEFPDEFVNDMGEDMFENSSDRVVYNMYLDWQANLARIALSDEE